MEIPCLRHLVISKGDALVHFVLQFLVDILPKESLLWKLKMLRSASCYVNSRLHAVKAQALILARYFIHYFLI